MKKVKGILLLIVFLFIPFLKLEALSDDSYVTWQLDRGIFAHQYKKGNDRITNLAMMEVNGRISYCVEPGISAQKDAMYSSTYDINDTHIDSTNIKRISLIGHYGYGYSNHTSKEYYMAAQELIWRLLGVENVWWTDSKEGGNTFNIEYYKNEILKLVDNYEVAPSFDIKDNYIVGDSNMKTSCDGVYAIGDVNNRKVFQLVSAMDDAVVASKDYLKNVN